MRPAAKDDVTAGHVNQLGDSETGLQCDKQQGPVTPPEPRVGIGCRHQCSHLRPVEVSDRCPLIPLGGNGKNPMAVVNKLRFMPRNVSKERPDGRQPCVAAAHTVAPHRLDEAQEATNEVYVKIFERQVRRRATKLVGRVVQQQAEGIPVARDGMGARPKTHSEVVREELLKADGKRITVHDAPPCPPLVPRVHTRGASVPALPPCTSRCETDACARDTS